MCVDDPVSLCADDSFAMCADDPLSMCADDPLTRRLIWVSPCPSAESLEISWDDIRGDWTMNSCPYIEREAQLFRVVDGVGEIPAMVSSHQISQIPWE